MAQRAPFSAFRGPPRSCSTSPAATNRTGRSSCVLARPLAPSFPMKTWLGTFFLLSCGTITVTVGAAEVTKIGAQSRCARRRLPPSRARPRPNAFRARASLWRRSRRPWSPTRPRKWVFRRANLIAPRWAPTGPPAWPPCCSCWTACPAAAATRAASYVDARRVPGAARGLASPYRPRDRPLPNPPSPGRSTGVAEVLR